MNQSVWCHQEKGGIFSGILRKSPKLPGEGTPGQVENVFAHILDTLVITENVSYSLVFHPVRKSERECK